MVEFVLVAVEDVIMEASSLRFETGDFLDGFCIRGSREG